jgi:hypothetical protein
MAAGAGIVHCLLLSAGCASAPKRAEILSIDGIGVRPVRVGAWINGYEIAVVSIASIMERELRLPAVQGDIHFYPDRETFRMALESGGYTPDFARDAAATLAGVGSYRRVLLNDAVLRELGWPHRVSMLAHELTHTLQYELSGGQRSTSDQWLREGFAEWVEVYVIDALGFTPRDEARRMAIRRVRDAARRRPLPVLLDLITIVDWVAALQQLGEEPVYAEALLAADLLIERHGVPGVLAYFRRFAASPDRIGHFRSAFDETPLEFDATFRAHLAGLR